jgi:hypothetical protein
MSEVVAPIANDHSYDIARCAHKLKVMLTLLLFAGCPCLQAAKALRDYSVHAVVANLLHTRKDRVLIVRGKPVDSHSSGDAADDRAATKEQQAIEVLEVLRPAEELHIEGQLVAKVILLHRGFQSVEVK